MKLFGNKLDEIIKKKELEIKSLIPIQEKLKNSAYFREDFRSLFISLGGGIEYNPEEYDNIELSVIAEVKRKSPSAGIIEENFDPIKTAQDYEKAGANAISVLTDKSFFGGCLSYLSKIREVVDIPLLRKDFIIHEAQIYESVVSGADAILLIVAILDKEALFKLYDIATQCHLDVIVEVHNLEEMDIALELNPNIIGINNRNLKTFSVDLEVTKKLSEEVNWSSVLISESGIYTHEDTKKIKSWGCNSILVGEALMKTQDKELKIREFKNLI